MRLDSNRVNTGSLPLQFPDGSLWFEEVCVLLPTHRIMQWVRPACSINDSSRARPLLQSRRLCARLLLNSYLAVVLTDVDSALIALQRAGMRTMVMKVVLRMLPTISWNALTKHQVEVIVGKGDEQGKGRIAAAEIRA